MAMYVYSTQGEPIGFVMETFIHDMEGRALGHIMGSRVHRFDGTYVGEWYKEMVVAKPDGRPRTILPIQVPARRIPPGPSFNRRVVLHNGYQDVFHLLTVGRQEESYDLAAE